MASSPPNMQAVSISPFVDTKLSLSSKSLSISSDAEARAFKARRLLPDTHAQMQASLGHRSDESADSSDDELFLDIDMDALRQRGKGSYSCPKAYQCKKGGVDKDGNLVIFDRNSSFAYVAAAANNPPPPPPHLPYRSRPGVPPRRQPERSVAQTAPADRRAQAALQQAPQAVAV